jgi:hypothetical protein
MGRVYIEGGFLAIHSSIRLTFDLDLDSSTKISQADFYL